MAAKCRPLSAKIFKNLCTISLFQKLWPFVSAHVRVFPTFKPISKSTHPSKFYYNYSFETWVYFQLQSFSKLFNSPAVPVNRQVLPSKLEHGFVEFLGSKQSSTPWPHFGLKYPTETSFQSWTSSRIR